MSVLRGGISSWLSEGRPVAPLDEQEREGLPWKEFRLDELLSRAEARPVTPDSAFLPRIAGQAFLEGHSLPSKRDMVVLFVDMVASTRLVLEHSPEEVLEILQAFMEIVIDVGAYHCGDVHDFEGDGALLYFEGPGEAVPAAFRLRDALIERRATLPRLPLPRISMDGGPLVIGVVGTRFRQTVSLVGPSVHIAARILKTAPPGSIIATDSIVGAARRSSPDLAARFVGPTEIVPTGGEGFGPVRVWTAPPEGSVR